MIAPRPTITIREPNGCVFCWTLDDAGGLRLVWAMSVTPFSLVRVPERGGA